MVAARKRSLQNLSTVRKPSDLSVGSPPVIPIWETLRAFTSFKILKLNGK